VIIAWIAGQAVKSPASIRTGHTVTPKLRHGDTYLSKTWHSIATPALKAYMMNAAPSLRLTPLSSSVCFDSASVLQDRWAAYARRQAAAACDRGISGSSGAGGVSVTHSAGSMEQRTGWVSIPK
jgi:hypothetical protein